jgi:hypothetical protein
MLALIVLLHGGGHQYMLPYTSIEYWMMQSSNAGLSLCDVVYWTSSSQICIHTRSCSMTQVVVIALKQSELMLKLRCVRLLRAVTERSFPALDDSANSNSTRVLAGHYILLARYLYATYWQLERSSVARAVISC